jgi:MSHA biogenesis protein MshP
MCCKYQQGFSLPVAIFILVVMALVAVAAVSIMQTGQSGVSNDVMSTRAFYAAESGAQQALQQLFPLSGGAAACNASVNQSYSTDGLNNCSSTTTCSSQLVNGKNYYILNSTGICASGDIQAVRQVEVMAAQP